MHSFNKIFEQLLLSGLLLGCGAITVEKESPPLQLSLSGEGDTQTKMLLLVSA